MSKDFMHQRKTGKESQALLTKGQDAQQVSSCLLVVATGAICNRLVTLCWLLRSTTQHLQQTVLCSDIIPHDDEDAERQHARHPTYHKS